MIAAYGGGYQMLGVFYGIYDYCIPLPILGILLRVLDKILCHLKPLIRSCLVNRSIVPPWFQRLRISGGDSHLN